MSGTRTYAILEVSPAAHEEISKKLRAAGYDHALHEDDEHGTVVDMHGIALARNPQHQDETRDG